MEWDTYPGPGPPDAIFKTLATYFETNCYHFQHYCYGLATCMGIPGPAQDTGKDPSAKQTLGLSCLSAWWLGWWW